MVGYGVSPDTGFSCTPFIVYTYLVLSGETVPLLVLQYILREQEKCICGEEGDMMVMIQIGSPDNNNAV